MFRSRADLKDFVWLTVAYVISQLGTCSRRKVGCVFLDKRGRILATGYNGNPPDEPHCIDVPCAGAKCKSGEGLDLCEAVHAEQNAIAFCKFPDEVHTVYCTDSPCLHCVKMLATTGAKRIVFARAYPHSAARERWLQKEGRLWHHLPLPGVS